MKKKRLMATARGNFDMGEYTLWDRLADFVKFYKLTEWFYWRFVPGEVVTVKWPTGWVVLHEADGHKISVDSADPNDHYRPWLEKNVGRQGIDWNWRMGNNHWAFGDARTNSNGVLDIKFRKGKTKYATIAALMWN